MVIAQKKVLSLKSFERLGPNTGSPAKNAGQAAGPWKNAKDRQRLCRWWFAPVLREVRDNDYDVSPARRCRKLNCQATAVKE
jgi:hypothetical protein